MIGFPFLNLIVVGFFFSLLFKNLFNHEIGIDKSAFMTNMQLNRNYKRKACSQHTDHGECSRTHEATLPPGPRLSHNLLPVPSEATTVLMSQ